MQRAFNFVLAAAGLLLLSPLLAMIALAIKWDDGGPVFYSQSRMGRRFRAFFLLKFRTMTVDADRAGLLTTANDPRVTRVGRKLRRYKLDELPQLWNVLKGEMQFVGSRPEVEPYVAMFLPQYELLLQEPPGITDPASLAYRHEEQALASDDVESLYTGKILPHKLRLSLEYQRRRTLTSDLTIIINTFLRLAD